MKLLQISALGPAPTWEGAYWILRMTRRAVSLSDRMRHGGERRGGWRRIKDRAGKKSVQQNSDIKHVKDEWIQRDDEMKVRSLLLNLLIRVALFLGKVGFDLKVDTTSLQSRNKTCNNGRWQQSIHLPMHWGYGMHVILLWRRRALPSPCHQGQAAERLSMAGCWESEEKDEHLWLNKYVIFIHLLSKWSIFSQLGNIIWDFRLVYQPFLTKGGNFLGDKIPLN